MKTKDFLKAIESNVWEIQKTTIDDDGLISSRWFDKNGQACSIFQFYVKDQRLEIVSVSVVDNQQRNGFAKRIFFAVPRYCVENKINEIFISNLYPKNESVVKIRNAIVKCGGLELEEKNNFLIRSNNFHKLATALDK